MLNYQKRKNDELFKQFENPALLFLSNTQNYIPIYKRFFNLADSNYNCINLKNNWNICSIHNKLEDSDNIFNCKLKHSENNKTKDKDVFFKLAPLLDPYKYMIGKYNISDSLFTLPKLNSTKDDCNSKIIDLNNTAYVDGLFLFLSSQLSSQYNFIHGVQYYGSFLSIKNNFKINVFDDLECLHGCDFFNQNKNVLFTIDDYDHLFKQEKTKLKILEIGNNVSLKSVHSLDNEIFDDLFEDGSSNYKNTELTLVDIKNMKSQTEQCVTLKSNSTCSSRSSHTNDDEELCENCDGDEFDDDDNELEEDGDLEEEVDDDNEVEDLEDGEVYEDDDDDDDEDEEQINVTIPKFPVQVIGMECCENTFDDLILTVDLTNDEWLSALMQIIMILITYQKAFHFTHNDLHTNNIMYNNTTKKFLYYCYNGVYYKVPTFGRLFKIIDFGRSIFKYDGKTFCSDSFQIGGDAATQYNTEPYFNDNKPRLEPNFSFDLCRLACSIFDYIIDDFEEIKDLGKIKDPVKRIIFEWCLDDKGINMLYKNNGAERYPEFKLYKMISRCVHNHTPQAQLMRKEFKAYSVFNETIKNSSDILNIDKIPCHF